MSGPQKWALILPSSARVSLVTYTAVIAVRYPELDNVQNDLICFGNYLLGEQATSGGFLPFFWDAPSAYMHAATDIGSAVDWLQSQVELNSVKFIQLRSLGILKTKTQQETLKSNKN